jgi:hypothetical protein
MAYCAAASSGTKCLLQWTAVAHPQLAHYLAQMTHQAPIESQFVRMLTDNLNAEIVLGTVANIREVQGSACSVPLVKALGRHAHAAACRRWSG